ncbi:NAD-dependent epimerase/dehydratase [Immersiella caudata]|uniref:NAD-dependent epimerase/dehydratase n=1 Tax=Immersiella caudata TaxID=314043 RepID=A0AA39XFZ5_9PEZI|nr:NAD-dependent epimerase/dehydratase [Immersiella caudata]
MPTKLLLTGVTGYIGGDIFSVLIEAHPELEYTLIVRNEERANLVREKYPADTNPNVTIKYGTTAPYTTVLEDEASKTDIIVHTAESADDVPSAKAIAAGILRAKDRSPTNPIVWIHLCGTGILQWYDQVHRRIGQPPLPHETYDDIASLPRLLTLPDEALHRDVDKIVLGVNHLTQNVKTAIVAPPTIYGVGRGPVNTISQQLPGIARFILEHGYAPAVAPTGLTEWDNVHISDVSSLFLALVEAAVNPNQRDNPEIFGLAAYYFCENGKPHAWADVSAKLAQEAVELGYLKEVVTKLVGIDEATVKSMGSNSRSVASRARKYLAWETKGPALEPELAGVMETEAKRLAVKKL